MIECYDATTRARKLLSIRVFQKLDGGSPNVSPVPILIVKVMDEGSLIVAELSTQMLTEIKVIQVRRP